MSGCPPRWAAKIRSQVAADSAWLIASKPNASQVAGEHSTMKVAVRASNW